MKKFSHEIVSISCEMKPISYEIKAISHEMKPISYEIEAISYEMKPISCEIKPISYEMKFISYEMKPISHEIFFISYVDFAKNRQKLAVLKEHLFINPLHNKDLWIFYQKFPKTGHEAKRTFGDKRAVNDREGTKEPPSPQSPFRP
jgi:hypothetical protein